MTFLLSFLVAFAAGVYVLFRYQPQSAQLSLPQVIGAFLFRIALGCAYGFIMQHYFPGDDTNLIHLNGLKQYDLLLHNTSQFFKDFIYLDVYTRPETLTMRWYYILGQWENLVVFKLLAFFNLFSGGNYYVNVVLLNVFAFKGVHWLMATIQNSGSVVNMKSVYVILFFFPGTTFWMSGIRAEALLIFFIGALWYLLFRGSSWIKILVSIFFIAVLRNQLMLCFLPAVVGYFFGRRKRLSITVAYGITIFLFVIASVLLPHGGPMHFIAAKQADFMSLPGKTVFDLPMLNDSIGSLFRALPFAFVNSMFRPLFFDARGVFQILSSINTLLLWALVIAIALNSRQYVSAKALALMLAAVCSFIVIGLIVPFPGAIIRYRAIPELMLIGALLCMNTKHTQRHRTLI
jgi:hypothetical protein